MKLRQKTVARMGMVSAALFGVALLTAPMATAATQSGSAVIDDPVSGTVLSSGASTSNIELKTNNAGTCTGSSLSGYFVTGYISSVAPTALTWDATGPHAATGTAYPMFDVSQTSYVARNTGTPPSGQSAGPVLPTGALTWSLFDTTALPPGTYHVGLACIQTGTILDNYWDTTLTITGTAGGAFNWSLPTTPVVPEFPVAVVLPVSALAILGAAGAFEMRRRRQDRATLAA